MKKIILGLFLGLALAGCGQVCDRLVLDTIQMN